MPALQGDPILLAEIFIDRSRFAGSCYRAANWQALGYTKGFARLPRGRRGGDTMDSRRRFRCLILAVSQPNGSGFLTRRERRCYRHPQRPLYRPRSSSVDMILSRR